MRIALAALLLVAACKTTSGARANDPSAPRPLTFGLTSPLGANAAAASSKQLGWYLSEALKKKVTARVFDNASALADALVAGEIDSAWLTPGSYVRAVQRGAITPLMKLSRGGYTSYQSVFFTRTGREAKDMAAVQGKTLAILGAGSMSGHVYPLAWLQQHQIDAAHFFGKIVEAKDHGEICRLVFDGKVDVGVTLSDVRASGELQADGCRESGMDPTWFAVFENAGLVPNDLIATRAGLDAASVARLREAFDQLPQSDAGRSELKNIFRADGFAPTADSDFDPVRALEKQFPE